MDVEAFIDRWRNSADGTPREGGAERANDAMFQTEPCTRLGVPQPEPAVWRMRVRSEGRQPEEAPHSDIRELPYFA